MDKLNMNINETRIIKTSPVYWVGIMVTFFIYIIASIFAVSYLGINLYLISGFLILVAGLYFTDIKSAYNAKILLTSQEIQGQVGRLSFLEAWNDIKSASLSWQATSYSGQKMALTLTILTEKNYIQIPCDLFDRKYLEQCLREHLSPEILSLLPYYREPEQLQELDNLKTLEFDSLNEPLKVSIGNSEKIIGGISILFGLFMASLSFVSGSWDRIYALLIMTLFFCGLGLVIILFSIGRLEATAESIKLFTVFQEFELPWSTLREVYLNINNNMLVLTGEKCRIIFPGPGNWSGKDKNRFSEFINIKIKTSGLQPMMDTKPRYWRSKNFKDQTPR